VSRVREPARLWAKPGPAFLRVAAVCALASAVTTVLLWYLPRTYPAATTFEARVALHTEPRYLARQWVNLVHVPLALVGYLGAGVALRRLSAGWTALGGLAFLLWGFTELAGVSIILVAVNGAWRPAYARLGDESTAAAERAALRTLLEGWDAVWDALFFLLLLAFLGGSLAYGLAALRGERLARAAGVLLLAAVPLTALILLGSYAGVAWAPGLVAWAYPALQPVSRATLGIWLWREATMPYMGAGGASPASGAAVDARGAPQGTSAPHLLSGGTPRSITPSAIDWPRPVGRHDP
jgi:hypothetical protein